MIHLGHRIALFVAGLTLLSSGIALIPALASPSKPATALLGVTTLATLLVDRASMRLGVKDLWVALFAFMLAISLSYAYSQGLDLETVSLSALSWFSIVAFYFLLRFAIRSLRDANALVSGLIAGAVVASISVLLGYGVSDLALSGEEQRTGGIAGDPNFYAMGAAASTMAAIYLLIQSRSVAVRLLIGASMVIMVAGSLASLSRGGFVALGAASVFLLYRMIQWGHYVVLLPAIMIVLAMPIFMPEAVRERILTLTTTNMQLDASIQSRLDQYERAMTMFAENPVIGVGIRRSSLSEAFGGAVSRQDLRSMSAETRHYNVVHNAYLIVLVEMGLLGIIPYLMIFVLSWVEFSRLTRMRWTRAYRENRGVRDLVWLGAMLQTAFVAMAVAALFINAARFKALWMLFGLSSALLALAQSRIRRAVDDDQPAALSGPEQAFPARG